MKAIFKLKYLLIILLIIWIPFQLFILKVDGAGISVLILAILVFFNESLKNNLLVLFRQKPFSIWGVWIFYNFVNTLSIGYSGESTWAFFIKLFYPLLILLIFQNSMKFNKKALFNILTIGFYTYIAFVLIFAIESLIYDRENGVLNANAIGINSFVLVFVLILKYIHKHLKLLPLFLLSIIPIILIVISASRKSFVCLFIIVLAVLITKLNGSLKKQFFIITFITICFYFISFFSIKNTRLGERFTNVSNQTEEMDHLKTNTIFDNFGDRGIFYYHGWGVFIENPINGIGLQNFKENATDFNFSIHSEYMVNIAEGGIIGTTLFFLFYYWIWKQLKQVFKKFKNVWRITIIYIAGFTSVLFINTAAWTYDSISVFIILGLIIGYVKQFEFLNKNHLGHHQF